MDENLLIQEKLREYQTMIAPLDRAGAEVDLARGMVRARTEDELHQISPALGALSEILGISSIDMLLDRDRRGFLERAVEQSGLTLDDIRRRLADAGPSSTRDDLKLLGFGESL